MFHLKDDIREELKEFFPYSVIGVARAEGDDVIAALTEWGRPRERDVIYSTDRDFIQCVNDDVDLWNWRDGKLTTVNDVDPEDYLFEHVLRGDVGDGIPNVLSHEDTLVTEGMRQKPMTKKRFDALMNGDYDEVVNKRIEKNYKLISLRMTPGDIKTEIQTCLLYTSPSPRDRQKSRMPSSA